MIDRSANLSQEQAGLAEAPADMMAYDRRRQQLSPSNEDADLAVYRHVCALIKFRGHLDRVRGKVAEKIVNRFMLTQRGKGLSQNRFEAFLKGTPAWKGQMGLKW